LSFLEILAQRRQKSISVEFIFATVFAFKHHVSAAHVIDDDDDDDDDNNNNNNNNNNLMHIDF